MIENTFKKTWFEFPEILVEIKSSIVFSNGGNIYYEFFYLWCESPVITLLGNLFSSNFSQFHRHAVDVIVAHLFLTVTSGTCLSSIQLTMISLNAMWYLTLTLFLLFILTYFFSLFNYFHLINVSSNPKWIPYVYLKTVKVRNMLKMLT